MASPPDLHKIAGKQPGGHLRYNPTWNNTGTDWATPGSWNPSGPPTATDLAIFSPFGAGAGTTVNNPSLATAVSALSLTVFPNQNLGTWTFGGNGNLTLGGTGSTGITTYGPRSYTIDGPTLAGASATNSLTLNVTHGSALLLAGNTKIVTNQGNITINGGKLTLDNTILNATDRLTTSGIIKLNGGGTFELIGNSAGGVYNVGSFSTADNSTGGTNIIRVVSNSVSANPVLNFANTGTFSLRQGTRAVLSFESNGTLGAANGPRITFAGTPFVSNSVTGTGSGNLFTSSATGATSGWAIVRDALGTNFATYSTTPGVGVLSIATVGNGNPATITTVTTGAQLAASTGGTNLQFNAPGTTVTLAGTITGATLRISPTATGGVLNMGASPNALNVNAIMLDGALDYSIAGTGNYSSGNSKYIYVNNPATVLGISLNIAPASNTVLAGPGFVDLTGLVSQNTAGTSRITLAGGVLQSNATSLGFTSSDPGQLNLTGGILEIKGGANGTGTAADFRRPVGTGAGTVAWVNSATSEQGSGGFSAFGSAASVNLGGQATPTTLQWAAANFVGDGQALRFGSTKSNAVLTFLNPLQLDNGTAPQLREIQVTAGTGGDKTVFSEVISGGSTASLLKTGTGVLELTGANTYEGSTFITAGTLVANYPVPSISASSTGRGNVRVTNGGRLAGSGFVGTLGSQVTVLPGGKIRGDVDGGSTGTVQTFGGLTVVGASSNGGTIQVEATTSTASGVFAFGAVNLDVTAGKVNIELLGNSLLPGVYTIDLVGSSVGNFNRNGMQITGGFVFSTTDYAVTAPGYPIFTVNSLSIVTASTVDTLQLNFTVAPEPGTPLVLSLVGIGCVGWRRRRNR
jgi:autotransporter-associated beta strand protein